MSNGATLLPFGDELGDQLKLGGAATVHIQSPFFDHNKCEDLIDFLAIVEAHFVIKCLCVDLSGLCLDETTGEQQEQLAEKFSRVACLEIELASSELPMTTNASKAVLFRILQPSKHVLTSFTYTTRSTVLQVGEFEINAMGSFLGSALQSLDLGACALHETGIRALAPILQTCSNLQTLYLNQNAIGYEGAMALASALDANTTLRSLDLSHNTLTAQGLQQIFFVVQSSIEAFYLANCRQALMMQDLVKPLAACANLNKLDLTDNEFTTTVTSMGAFVFCNAFCQQSLPNLAHLYLDKCAFGRQGPSNLNILMNHCPALTYLSLTQNDLGSDGALVVMKELLLAQDDRRKLHTLDLSGNAIARWTIRQLVSMIRDQYKELQTISFGSDGAWVSTEHTSL